MFSKNNNFLILTLLLTLFGCDRSEEGFTKTTDTGYNATPDGLLNANPGDTIFFDRQDMRDLNIPPVRVFMTWLEDTVISLDTFRQLQLYNPDVDIILPDHLTLITDFDAVRRFVRNARYPLFKLKYMNPTDTNIYSSYGVNPHRFRYYWYSPYELVKAAGSTRIQVTSGIDSFPKDADWAKFVEFKFVQGVGIISIDQVKMFVAVSADTTDHYHWTRIN